MLKIGANGRRRAAFHPATRTLVVVLLSLTILAGCGDTRPLQEPEGSVAFRSGTDNATTNQTLSVPGPDFTSAGILIPAYEPVWQSAWLSKDSQDSLSQGSLAGLSTGIAVLQIAPLALTFWPVAVGAAGLVAGATVMGMLGVGQEDPSVQRMSPPDRVAIADATKALRPDRLFREAMGDMLARRAGTPLAVVSWHQAWGPDTPGTDPLIEARAKGLDGVLDIKLQAIGLAAGEERDTYGVFVQVGVRALDARDGRLRYEKVLSYGPGQPVDDLPRSDFHTVELLAMDKAHLYRHLASQAIARMAQLLAKDPALPLASR